MNIRFPAQLVILAVLIAPPTLKFAGIFNCPWFVVLLPWEIMMLGFIIMLFVAAIADRISIRVRQELGDEDQSSS